MSKLPYFSHYRALLKLGVPIVIGQVGTILLGLADTLMIGHHSTPELAASSFVNNMFNLAIITMTGFSYGLTPLVSMAYGRGERQRVGMLLRHSLIANTLVALLLTLVMTVLYFNLHRMGQPSELIPLMRPYFVTLLVSLVFVMLFNAFKQFADGITDTRTSMGIQLLGNVLNIAGNYVLIYGKFGFPEWGLMGAGVSTLFSRIVMVGVFVAIFFCRRGYADFRKGYRESSGLRADLVALHRLGSPIALQMGMETASFSLSTLFVGWLGTTALAAHQVMLAISQICFMMYYGMGAAVAVRVSNFYGQRDMQNVRASSFAGFHLILVNALLCSLPILLCRNYLGGLFSDSAEVALLVAQLVIPFVIYQFGDGLQINFANSLRGITDVRPMVRIAFIAYFMISLPAGYFFAFILGWGLLGVWMAFPFGLTTAGLLYYRRFNRSTAPAA